MSVYPDVCIPARRRNALTVRAGMIQEIRRFFHASGYLEVETPYRIPAPAPEAHIEAIASDGWFLHTSPELCMKRLLGAGYTKIFQIAKCFRDRERGRYHLTEFTLLEWYRIQTDYLDMMVECEELIRSVAHGLIGKQEIYYKGEVIDLSIPWERISVKEAFERFAPCSMRDALRTECFDEIMVTSIEPHLCAGKPVFLYDYPIECGALAQAKRTDPSVAERFELYIGGLELANAFSELTDVEEQRKRFDEAREDQRKQQKNIYPVPEKFLQALQFMPPASGIALGLDRLAMIFTDSASIDDVVTFTPEEL